MSEEKGYDISIRLTKKLLDNGYNIRWYCIGEGNERRKLEDKIKAEGLEEEFILMGSKSNPYPYMKDADIYVQTSRTEGYCITLAEARALNKAIVTTDFSGAREQIEDGKTGIIVKYNENEIYNSIIKLIDDFELRRNFEYNLSLNKIDTRDEVNKIYRYLG